MSTYKLINALQTPAIYDHPTGKFEVIETHCSWILLTGSYAYKIKKPVDFGFLDFSTLAKRAHYCREELRLNQRLAPELYLEVVCINGSENNPQIETKPNDNTIEYAVKMVQFPQQAQLDRILSREGYLPTRYINHLAKQLAKFHQNIPSTTTAATAFGSPESIKHPVKENFEQIKALLTLPQDISILEDLEEWSYATHKKLTQTFKNRKTAGHIKECHGDMHLGNIALINDKIVFFDCLEFNQNLRWIDTMSETAFILMDLDDHKQSHLANCLLNVYLETSGDYQGLALLSFYLVYRAIVRAKVATLRAAQKGMTLDERIASQTKCRNYLELAKQYTRKRSTPIIITHGLSGSGKSTASQLLLENYRAIRIRSDVERKRMFKDNLYTTSSTEKTYNYLATQAETIIESGFPAIIDATFLKHKQRKQFYELSKKLNVPFIILHTDAPLKQLKQWITQRSNAPENVSDADHKVLENQLDNQELLDTTEKRHTITINTAQPIEINKIIDSINRICNN